jgi:cyclase
MDRDGNKNGFANKALAQLSTFVNIPIIASGGAGTEEHFVDAYFEGQADAALAASVFHFQKIAIPQLKGVLQLAGVAVR